jgi:oligopeptide/dipeptide ABC transporter ATP-binding protein
VHLSIDRGQAAGLVGESGCGKSTLGRAALLLERPSAGRVMFDGVDLMRLKPAALRRLRGRMQMIFQDPRSSLNPRMTVGQLAAEPYQIHHPRAGGKELNERVELLLAQVGLDPNVADRYPHEFSGGQRQRIAIARALSCDPEFIVADEPTSALDVSVQAQTLNLLIDLQEERDLTFLFISHNLRVIQLFCHTMAVMYLGEIVETGPTGDVTSQPAHPYTDALMDAVPSVHESMKPTPLDGDVPSPVDLPSGCAFHPRCPEPDKPEACYHTPPPLDEVAPHRKAACHLAADRLTRNSR